MSTDPQLVICLLAIKQLGGREVPRKQEPFSKGLAKPLATAIENGLVTSEKVTQRTIGPTGKPKNTKIDVLSLTGEGESTLQREADPAALAATAGGLLARWKERLEADRLALREEITAAVRANMAPTAVPDKPLKDLAKTVGDLAKRLEKIESSLNGESNGLLEKIEAGFSRLLDGVAQADPVIAAAPVVPTSAPVAALTLSDALRQAYKDQCLDIEHEDGVVPLPRLFHQARHVYPNLSVEAFHHELFRLWDERIVDLKIINEVRRAVEPDKAIRRGDDLYYFVKWRN